MKRIPFGLKCALISGITLIIFFLFSFNEDNSNKNLIKNLDIFNSIYKELDLFYVDSVPTEKIIRYAIDGMLEDLDPYTNYFPESEGNELKRITKGTYAGIGVGINFYEGGTAITEIVEDSPAAHAQLKAGDKFIAINGENVNNKDPEYISHLLEGEQGSTISLQIKRPGIMKTLDFKVERRLILTNIVPYYGKITSDIGYILLTEFTDQAAQEVKTAFINLKRQGISSLILDLRDNPGGILEQAIEVVNFFIPQKTKVLSTKGKNKEWNETYQTTHLPLDTLIPLTILVNDVTASAAEIVAGTLQDLDRGVIIGTRTFGKGLVQTVHPLPFNGNLKLTTAKYYIPSGRCIQAIDYRFRRQKGKENEELDRLESIFYTRNGRKVKEGKGIQPDIEIKPDTLSNITFYLNPLIDKEYNLVFDYVTAFCQEHPEIASPETFVLSEIDYQNFINQVQKTGFEYDRYSEKLLSDLQEAAQNEGYYSDILPELNTLKNKLRHNLKHDLIYFKNDIKDLLCANIILRYYYRRGVIIYQLRNDQVLKKAIQTLNTPKDYKNILKVTSL